MTPDLDHEANLAFLREGRGGLTLGATYYGTEAQYRQAHGLDVPEEAETSETELPSSDAEPDGSEKDHNNETTLVLIPGSAVLLHGSSPDESRRWIAPDDFELFLESAAGVDELEGKVREILVGSWRESPEGDPERLPGLFLSQEHFDSHCERLFGDLESAVHGFCKQIGIDPAAEQSAEQLPRGESWLAERADADAKLTALESELTALKSASGGNSTGLPGNLRDILTSIKGVGDKLADEIIAALVPLPPR